MAKCFISFLGTNRYRRCRYQFGSRISPPLRFVQEWTAELSCRKWSANDRIVIFTTTEARDRNWLDNGHERQQGLAARLHALQLPCPVEMSAIPEEHDESQIWDIFSIVLEHLKREDEVVFDVTHSFRSIPLLAMVILNYAKVAYKIRLEGIYYGAFEVLGPSFKVPEVFPDPNDRIAPILDLTPLDRLLDWSFAVDKLVKAGDATALQALARASVTPLLKESKGKNVAAQSIRRLGDALQTFTQSLSTCRGRTIGDNATDLQRILSECAATDLVNPLKPLIAEIEKEVAPFRQDPVADGLHAAMWCQNHHLIQQGITILYETLMSWCLFEVGESGCTLDRTARTIASQAMSIANKGTPESQWASPACDRPGLTRRLVAMANRFPEAVKAADALQGCRNDINHGGMRENSMLAASFEKTLREQLQVLQSLLAGNL